MASSPSGYRPTEFSFAAPVMSEGVLYGPGDAQYHPLRPRGLVVSATRMEMSATGPTFVNEAFRVGGPVLCPLPALTVPLIPSNPDISRLIEETPTLVETAIAALRQFEIVNAEVTICGRVPERHPEQPPVANSTHSRIPPYFG